MLSLTAQADVAEGLSFMHNDWQLVCDNTRTCRAAGYQHDNDRFDEALPVSVLLTREAGANQPVTGQLQLGSYDEIEGLDGLPDEFELTMYIDDRTHGLVTMQKDEWIADLAADQVAALLVALTGSSNIRWTAAGLTWELSDSGSSAALLKMDEFQGRLGTVGALYRPGTAPEDDVLPALEVPIVIAAEVSDALPSDARYAAEDAEAVRAALLATVEDDDCYSLSDGDNELTVIRLSETKLLVTTLCWRGAYQESFGYWVIGGTAPYSATLVTDAGTDYREGTIWASFRGRGVGDCVNVDSWTWDGEQFVHTESRSTGMCRLIALGGAWTLPTIVTDVREASAEPEG